MFPKAFFAKTYWAGVYWQPTDGVPVLTTALVIWITED